VTSLQKGTDALNGGMGKPVEQDGDTVIFPPSQTSLKAQLPHDRSIQPYPAGLLALGGGGVWGLMGTH
jgi:hypothetical protein